MEAERSLLDCAGLVTQRTGGHLRVAETLAETQALELGLGGDRTHCGPHFWRWHLGLMVGAARPWV